MSSPSQLFSCVEVDNIRNSPINNSTAKNHWTFSKDHRFKKPKIQCDAFYNIPGLDKNENRKTAMGYGKQTDLSFHLNPHHVVPSPDTYNLPTFVGTNRLHNKGFTPRFSREEIAPMSYIDIQAYKMPPPGTYHEYRYNESPKWSMRPRISSEIFPQTTIKIVPEPSRYNNQEAIEYRKDGRYYLSNHRNTKAKVFNPPRSQRFTKSSTPVPDPATYLPQNDLSSEGKYVLSKNISAGQRKFLFGRRSSFTDVSARRSFTPGPGSYRVPSQFGHYDQKKLRGFTASVGTRVNNVSSKTDRTKVSQAEQN